jgi:hypothetical protein
MKAFASSLTALPAAALLLLPLELRGGGGAAGNDTCVPRSITCTYGACVCCSSSNSNACQLSREVILLE